MVGMYPCPECRKEWPSPGYADDCREQCILEAEDRASNRLFGINRGRE